uniref:(northern house mosquito) hypothetical protein n=1 Tax=Culex pipiens TaxID=7175 RepID=A0A8D8GKK7_CULPI
MNRSGRCYDNSAVDRSRSVATVGCRGSCRGRWSLCRGSYFVSMNEDLYHCVRYFVPSMCCCRSHRPRHCLRGNPSIDSHRSARDCNLRLLRTLPEPTSCGPVCSSLNAWVCKMKTFSQIRRSR